MNEKQRQRIIDRHRDSHTRHGYHPNALYWSSTEIQEIRFRVLAEIGIELNDSVLDVGCGFADFKSWMERQDKAIDFTGIDLSAELIHVAKQKHPDGKLLCGELFDFDFEPRSFDWVVLSGAMNEQLHDDGGYAYKMIAAMFELCSKGLAFNVLNARQIKAHDLQSFEPQNIVDYCQGLCGHVVILDDYLPNDFTIHMSR